MSKPASLQVPIVNGMSKAVSEQSKSWQSKQAGKNEILYAQYCFLNTTCWPNKIMKNINKQKIAHGGFHFYF